MSDDVKTPEIVEEAVEAVAAPAAEIAAETPVEAPVEAPAALPEEAAAPEPALAAAVEDAAAASGGALSAAVDAMIAPQLAAYGAMEDAMARTEAYMKESVARARAAAEQSLAEIQAAQEGVQDARAAQRVQIVEMTGALVTARADASAAVLKAADLSEAVAIEQEFAARAVDTMTEGMKALYDHRLAVAKQVWAPFEAKVKDAMEKFGAAPA